MSNFNLIEKLLNDYKNKISSIETIGISLSHKTIPLQEIIEHPDFESTGIEIKDLQRNLVYVLEELNPNETHHQNSDRIEYALSLLGFEFMTNTDSEEEMYRRFKGEWKGFNQLASMTQWLNDRIKFKVNDPKKGLIDKFLPFTEAKVKSALKNIFDKNQKSFYYEYYKNIEPVDGDWHERFIIDIFGLVDNEYNRQATAKILYGNMSKMAMWEYNGELISLRHVLALVGPQGKGKSQLFELLYGKSSGFFKSNFRFNDTHLNKAIYMCEHLICENNEAIGITADTINDFKGDVGSTILKTVKKYKNNSTKNYSRASIIITSNKSPEDIDNPLLPYDSSGHDRICIIEIKEPAMDMFEYMKENRLKIIGSAKYHWEKANDDEKYELLWSYSKEVEDKRYKINKLYSKQITDTLEYELDVVMEEVIQNMKNKNNYEITSVDLNARTREFFPGYYKDRQRQMKTSEIANNHGLFKIAHKRPTTYELLEEYRKVPQSNLYSDNMREANNKLKENFAKDDINDGLQSIKRRKI